MSIGNVIKDRRIALNIKQEVLAEMIGVTVQTYSKWENNKTEPKASQVAQLSEVLKLTEREICKGEMLARSNNPVDFMSRVGKVMHHVNDINLMLTLYQFIDDEDRFISELKKESGLPEEVFEQ